MTSENSFSFVHLVPEMSSNYQARIWSNPNIKIDENCIIEYLDEEEKEKSMSESNTDSEESGSDDDKSETSRHWWTRAETVVLIESVDTEYKRINKLQTRRRGWNNVLNNLIEHNIILSMRECMTKWRSLLRNYYAVKLNRTEQTGLATQYEYFEKIDDLLKRHSTNSNASNVSSSEEGPSHVQGTHPVISSMPFPNSNASSGKVVYIKTEKAKSPTSSRKMRNRSQKLQSRRCLNRIVTEWKARQEEWQDRHVEKKEILQFYKQKLQLRAQKLELLEKYIIMKEKQNNKCNNNNISEQLS